MNNKKRYELKHNFFGPEYDNKEIKKTLNLKKILIKKKHRYIYLLANKKDKKNLLKKLNYPILDYPKFQNKNYKTDTNITTQGLLI